MPQIAPKPEVRNWGFPEVRSPRDFGNLIPEADEEHAQGHGSILTSSKAAAMIYDVKTCQASQNQNLKYPEVWPKMIQGFHERMVYNTKHDQICGAIGPEMVPMSSQTQLTQLSPAVLGQGFGRPIFAGTCGSFPQRQLREANYDSLGTIIIMMKYCMSYTGRCRRRQMLPAFLPSKHV